MTEPYRYYVRSPDGRAIFGFESTEAAETAARAYGEGAHVIDTLAQAYRPMLQEMRGGALAEARGRDEIAEVLRGAGGRRVGVIGDSA